VFIYIYTVHILPSLKGIFLLGMGMGMGSRDMRHISATVAPHSTGNGRQAGWLAWSSKVCDSCAVQCNA
jgi:hypothetical protein